MKFAFLRHTSLPLLLWAALTCGLVAPASAAFTINGDGTVSDSSTRLMWMQCSRGQSGAACAGAASTYNWAGALTQATAANAANELGYNDWRLPNMKELESLIDRSRVSPAIDPTYFPNTLSDWYWSSTTHAGVGGIALFVHFGYGHTGNTNKTFGLWVRLVRDGQSFDRLLPATATLTQTGASATDASFSTTLAAAPVSGGANTMIGYWLVRAATDPAPRPDELIGGMSGVAAGNNPTGSGQMQTITVAGLTPGTQYVFYYAALDDTTNNLNLIRKQAFTMAAPPSPSPLPSPPAYPVTQAYVTVTVDHGINLYSIAGLIAPASSNIGQPGAYFVWAYLPATATAAPDSVWYLDSALNWHLFTDCRITPAYFTGGLQILDDLSIIPAPNDLSPFKGAELYFGYGLGGYAAPSGSACNDMLARQNFTKVYTVQ